MLKARKRLTWGTGVALALLGLLTLAVTMTAQEGPEDAASAATLVEAALAATDIQAVVNLLEGPGGAFYDSTVTVEGDDGVGIIPRLEAATGLSAGDFAGDAPVESEDPLVQALALAVAIDEALTAALAGGDADPAAVLAGQAEALETLLALLTGS
ncbi:MAG TPA: hypothetical protein VIL08_04575 [Limnochorda sp.]